MINIYCIEGADHSVLFRYKQKCMQAGFRDSVHNYDELKFVRILAGCGTWQINQKQYQVHPGDILLFCAADVRHIQSIDQDSLKIEQVNFMPAFLSPMQETADFFVYRSAGFSNLLPRDANVSRLMDELVLEILMPQTYQRQAVCNRLLSLVIAVARLLRVKPVPHNKQEHRQETVEQAMNYIRLHLEQDLTLESVAGEFYLSPAYFSRLFRHHCGMSFQEFLARARVSEVLSLIKSQHINILDAALQCGFRSSSGFYRTFRRITGTTPKRFL